MDSNKMAIIKKSIEKTAENLRKNNMDAYIIDTKEEVVPLIKTLIEDGCTVSNGGSMSLAECGVFDLLKNGDYNYILDNINELPFDKIIELYVQSLSADVFFCSSNAVTENGELYNVDGTSNRVSAIAFGPKSVIMVVGFNKIVKNLDDAIKRVKHIAAPMNCMRMNKNTYCKEKGECQAFLNDNASLITSGCHSDERICCNYLISSKQRIPHRIKVILVCDELGY